MVKKILVLLLMILVTSCSSVSPPQGEPPAVKLSEVTQPFIETPTLVSTNILGAVSPTFTPVPTLTPTLTLIPTKPVIAGNITPIQFAPNATFIDVMDGIPNGGKKTYSISASKGQVMSISINQPVDRDWVYIPMELIGADGSIFCSVATGSECEFWRGILPSTQEYLLTLMPASPVSNFTLRVVIPPLSATKQTFVFQNGSSILTYEDDFAPTRFSGAQVYKIYPDLALRFINTNYYKSTNLGEAYLLYGSSKDGNILSTCIDAISFGGPEQMIDTVTINGIPFVHSEGGGVAAGNIYEQIYYRTLLNGICHEVTFYIHYGNIGNYSPDSGIKEFDRAGLLQRFLSVLNSLVLN